MLYISPFNFFRAYLTDIHQRTGTIIQKQVEQPHVAGGSGAVASEVNSIIKEVKDSLNVIKREITTLAAKPQVKSYLLLLLLYVSIISI